MAYENMSRLAEKGKVNWVGRSIPKFTKISDEEARALDGIFGDWDTFTTYNKTKVFEEYHFRKTDLERLKNLILSEVILEEETELCEI